MDDHDTRVTKPMSGNIGVTPIEIIRSLSGLEYLTGIMKGDYPGPSIAGILQFKLCEVSKGVAVFTGLPDENHLNPMGTVHGGYAATLLDSALACAVQTLCPVGYASTSVELKVNFVRPITTRTGRLYSRGEVIHPGRQLATSEARLTDENGKLYAHGTQTCSLFKLPD